jgi:hypothetical protein
VNSHYTAVTQPLLRGEAGRGWGESGRVACEAREEGDLRSFPDSIQLTGGCAAVTLPLRCRHVAVTLPLDRRGWAGVRVGGVAMSSGSASGEIGAFVCTQHAPRGQRARLRAAGGGVDLRSVEGESSPAVRAGGRAPPSPPGRAVHVWWGGNVSVGWR